MSVLKDIECLKCGHVQEWLLDGDETEIRVVCPECDHFRRHRSICCGGCKQTNFTENVIVRDVEKHVEYLGCKAGQPVAEHIDTPLESRTATPEVFHDKSARAGQAIHDLPQFQKDALAAKRDKRKAKRERKMGITPITFMPRD